MMKKKYSKARFYNKLEKQNLAKAFNDFAVALSNMGQVSASTAYAMILENGHSQEQAPKGIYASAFQSLMSKYKG